MIHERIKNKRSLVDRELLKRLILFIAMDRECPGKGKSPDPSSQLLLQMCGHLPHGAEAMASSIFASTASESYSPAITAARVCFLDTPDALDS